jgi:hypothetical protein
LQVVHGDALPVDGSNGEGRHHLGARQLGTADIAESALAVGILRRLRLCKLLESSLGFFVPLQLS